MTSEQLEDTSVSLASKPVVAVIGAGPAGLMAAQSLAENGCRVTIFDHKAAPARKFLMAGRGGLNLTHTSPLDVALEKYGDAAPHLRAALSQFTPDDLRTWTHNLSQGTFVGTSGRVFPKSLKASPLLRAWLRHLSYFDVDLRLKQRWTGWNDNGALEFTNVTSTGETSGHTHFNADITVLALGGASWPNLGSDGHWTEILAESGTSLTPFVPSNASLLISWSDHLQSKFAGTPIKNIALSCNGKSAVGEAVITATGLEGGACYALNPVVRDALKSSDVAKLQLDLKPDLSQAQLGERLARPRGSQPQTNHIRKATGLSSAAITLLREQQNGALPQDPDKLADLIKHMPLTCTGLSGLDRAISSAGGVSFSAIGPDYMLKSHPGVFVAGEMLDWEAPTGGYLLQATFATAVAAAKAAFSYLQTSPNPTRKSA